MKPKGNIYNSGRNYGYDAGLNEDSDEIENSSSNEYYDNMPKNRAIGSNLGFKQAQTMKFNTPSQNKYDVNNPTYGLGSMGFSNAIVKGSNVKSGSLGLNIGGLGSSSGYGKKSDAYNIDLNTNKYDTNIEKGKKEMTKSEKGKDKDQGSDKKKETKQKVNFFDQLEDELEIKNINSEESSNNNHNDEYYTQQKDLQVIDKIKQENEEKLKNSVLIQDEIHESINQDQDLYQDEKLRKSSVTSQDNNLNSQFSKKEDYDQPEESYNKYVPNQPHSAEAMEEYMKKHAIFPPKDNEDKVKGEKEKDNEEDEYKEDFEANADNLQNQSKDFNHLQTLSDTSLKNFIRKKSSIFEDGEQKVLNESIKDGKKGEASNNPAESLDIDLSERMNILKHNKKSTPPKKADNIKTELKQTESNEIDFTNRLKLLSEQNDDEDQSKGVSSPFKLPVTSNNNENWQIKEIQDQKKDHQHQSELSVSSEDVQSLIRKEIGNYMKSGNLNTLLSINNQQYLLNQKQPTENKTGINEIKNEFDKLSISKSQLFSEGLRFKQFDNQKLYKSGEISVFLEGFSELKPKANISQMKLESSLNEERKRKELIAYELVQVKELNRKLEEELSKLQFIKLENLNLSKKIETSENQVNKMTQDFDELKQLYDHQIKLIEERIKSNAEFNKTNQIEKKYQMKIIVLQGELNEMKLEATFFKSKNEALEAENTKIRLNLEQNETILALKNDNFVLHEKNNELMKIKESFELELQGLKDLVERNSSYYFEEKKVPLFNENNAKSQESNGKVPQSSINRSEVFFVNQIQLNREGTVQNVFDYLIGQRESKAQENLLKSYVKEIERLNEEILFLKSMPHGDVLLKGNDLNKKQINPILKESIEEQMRKLQSFFVKEEKNYLISFIEKEFNRLQDKENEGEIAFNHFISILQSINVPLMSNELIEIFNNFPRSHGNTIRYNDFLNALLSKSPSAFYMQSDPSYLNNLESKLLIATNRVKELEKFIIVSASEKDDQKVKIDELTYSKGELETKVNQLNAQILNYFLNKEEKNISHPHPEIIQMKEKFKSLEASNQNSNSELYQRLASYEKKIEEMKISEKEKENQMKENNLLKESITKIKAEAENRHTALNNEINNLHQKLSKYKNNYRLLTIKNESLSQEKEKILTCLKEKGITADKVLTFANSYEEVKVLACKLGDLEKKNENREERYKQLCINANALHIQKEIETLTKHYEREKRELVKVIHQKNNEVDLIKTEFEEILHELEMLKASKIR